MKNKKKKYNDFTLLKRKFMLRFILYSVLIILGMFFLMILLTEMLRGTFGEFVVAVFMKIFRISYGSASNVYHILRSYDFLVYAGMVVIALFICFRICVGQFVKYLKEINRSLDLLLQENSEEAFLPRELMAIEEKFNLVKRTLESRKLTAKLSEQRKSDLIVYLAHDLKTPLTSVIGYLTLLKDEKQISEELQDKYLSISLNKAQRLEDLINEFFEITRFNLTEIDLQYSTVNLTRLLEQSAYEFRPMLQEKNLTYNLNAAENIMLQCDADKLQRVIDNLLRNAVFYSYSDTAIDITASCYPNEVSVCIVNSGDTIPSEKLDRIFEQFFRLDSSRASNSGGAGLGLAIAKRIVELHGGTITAMSDNNTVRFTVTIPNSITGTQNI